MGRLLKFSFTGRNQVKEWKLSYTRAVNFFKALDQKRRPVLEGMETDEGEVQGRRLQSLTDQHNYCRIPAHPYKGPEYHNRL